MDIMEKRDFILSHLHQSDEMFINNIYAKLQDIIANSETVVGYLPDGKPISKSLLIDRAIKSEKDIAMGRLISQDELEKEMKNW